MSFPFNAAQGLIRVQAEISGPARSSSLRLLLDTGATSSVIDPTILIASGYDSSATIGRVQIATGNGLVIAPRLILTRFTALGRHQFGFPVLSHALPPDTNVDGLLGLDFLRGLVMTLDFRSGSITVV